MLRARRLDSAFPRSGSVDGACVVLPAGEPGAEGVRRMDEQGEVVELFGEDERVARVAAIDIAKASAMVCTRLPSGRSSGRRVQRTWAVRSTSNAVMELADHLVCQGVELVVMESTSDYVRHEGA